MFDKLFGEFRRISTPEDEDDYEEDSQVIESRPIERKSRRGGAREREAYSDKRLTASRSTVDREILELRTDTLQKVVVVYPKSYMEEVQGIADYLCKKYTIVLNLEKTDKETARRILDFMAGVTYANEGMVSKVSDQTYVITPFTVSLIGALVDGLKSEGALRSENFTFDA